MGVIVATLIMTVSSVIHNNNLSDEVIIKEALKLGMIMPESTEEGDSLWDDSTQVDTEGEGAMESQPIEGTQTEADATVGVITVENGDAARHVSEKLLAVGLIEDPEDFRIYLSNMGYASKIMNGTYEIPLGSTYEEICNYIINK